MEILIDSIGKFHIDSQCLCFLNGVDICSATRTGGNLDEKLLSLFTQNRWNLEARTQPSQDTKKMKLNR